MDWAVKNDCRTSYYGYCYYGYFPTWSWTWGIGIFCGILGVTTGSLGVVASKNNELVDFFAKYGPTGFRLNVFQGELNYFIKLQWEMWRDLLWFYATDTFLSALDVIFSGCTSFIAPDTIFSGVHLLLLLFVNGSL